MEETTYLIEMNYNGYDISVKGVYNGSSFKIQTVEPMVEGGEMVIGSYKDLEQHILAKKFKK